MPEKEKPGKEKQIDIARAWKDPEYRKSLTPEQRALLPENPTGPPPASAEELREVVGGLTGRFGRASTDFCGTAPGWCTEWPDCCYNSTIGPRP
jgi:mersacidin/lichenicidin family type 2 lantibiotic